MAGGRMDKIGYELQLAASGVDSQCEGTAQINTRHILIGFHGALRMSTFAGDFRARFYGFAMRAAVLAVRCC